MLAVVGIREYLWNNKFRWPVGGKRRKMVVPPSPSSFSPQLDIGWIAMRISKGFCFGDRRAVASERCEMNYASNSLSDKITN